MPIADLLTAGTARLTSQQIADLMLVEDRARRAAVQRGDLAAARTHQIERDRLGAVLNG